MWPAHLIIVAIDRRLTTLAIASLPELQQTVVRWRQRAQLLVSVLPPEPPLCGAGRGPLPQHAQVATAFWVLRPSSLLTVSGDSSLTSVPADNGAPSSPRTKNGQHAAFRQSCYRGLRPAAIFCLKTCCSTAPFLRIRQRSVNRPPSPPLLQGG